MRKDVEDAFAEVTEREQRQAAAEPSGFSETGRRPREPGRRPGLEPSQRAGDFAPESRTRAAIIEPVGQPKGENPEWADSHAMVKRVEKAHQQSVFERIRLAGSRSSRGWGEDGDSSRQPFQVAESRDFSPLGVARTGDSDGISLKPFQVADASLSPDLRRVTDSGNPLLLRQTGNPGATRPTAAAESGHRERQGAPMDERKRPLMGQEAADRAKALREGSPSSPGPSVPSQLAALGMTETWRHDQEIPNLDRQLILNMEETRDKGGMHWWRQIQNDGEWNYKNDKNTAYQGWGSIATPSAERELAGNRNFGATCAALGLDKSTCLRGSGLFQGYSNFIRDNPKESDGTTSMPWWEKISPYRDKPPSNHLDSSGGPENNNQTDKSLVSQGRPWDLDSNSCMGEPADDCAAVSRGYDFGREYMDRYWKK
ncbi:MAG: hypothetical protein HQL82_14260 [Magnetococcales bacterium]|nr:hypothetical protein [Magnetococcales bacterium]